MAKNDLVLLDSILEKKKIEYSALKSAGDVFEIFAFENLLKDYDISYEDIERGWVDGGDDGGIDGFFIFVDGLLLVEVPDNQSVRKRPIIEVIIVTCKHEDTFRQIPLNSLLASIPELFDLSKASSSFSSKYNEDLIDQRDLFCDTCKELSVRQPLLKFSFIYSSRGDASNIPTNIKGRASLIQSEMNDLFSNCSSSFQFCGASELLQLTRRQQSLALKLTFIESYVSRQSNYVVLCKLSDYHKFIKDEQGVLRRYLFESNVRDFLGQIPVNEDIAATLTVSSKSDECDFWWLNNGITVIATAANVVGKEISLENIQIVNGLQTTENIFKYCEKTSVDSDDRAVLVKIIVTQNAEIRDRIIKATNYQTPVELSSLRATDKIQRDIEDILLKHNWFYDRRRNYYKNQGKPQQSIVSSHYLAACVVAIVLKDPARAVRLKTKFMRLDDQYKAVFSELFDIRIYPAVLSIIKLVEHYLLQKHPSWYYSKFVSDYKYLFAYAWIVRKLGMNYRIEGILDLANSDIDLAEFDEIWNQIDSFTAVKGVKVRRLCKKTSFIEALALRKELNMEVLFPEGLKEKNKQSWFKNFWRAN